MVSRSIFLELSPAELLEVSDLLTFNPVVSHQPFKFLNSLDNDAKLAWLDNNRDAVSSEFCRVGSWSFGSTKSYREIIVDFAFKISAEFQAGDAVESVERAIVLKLWNDAVSKLTPDQVEELKSRAQEIATKYGKSFGSEITGFAALSAAQLSGFGVYVLGSTILGALNGALGLGLSFGAFTGLSSLISTVIGPVGWAALGVFTIVRLGSPNYKKLLPVIVLIASKRSLASPDSVREATADTEGLLENVTDVG